MKIEVMDTTLRDGEQTSGVALIDTEKLNIAKMLLSEVKVDRIEVASARVSEGEFKAVKKITNWAKKKKMLDRVEVLGFIDNNKSLDWIKKAGARVVNLLCKGSLKHVKVQLKKTPEQHFTDIKKTVHYAVKNKIKVNVYLEDWSNGMRSSIKYVFSMLDSLRNEKIERFMLPDTLGILSPDETYEFCKTMIEKYPELKFDFHAHNDYDLAVANTLASVKAGCSGVHTTVNGLGERTGNAALSSVIASLIDHYNVKLSVDEKKLNKLSKVVEAFSGVRVPENKPIIGEHVFTQTCGIHADGDSKGNLYCNDLAPERFGRERKYALGKTSGKASIQQNLKALGMELDAESMRKVTKRVVELGDKKENITKDDLPYVIADVLGDDFIDDKIRIKNYFISHTYGLKPVAALSMEVKGKVYEETSTGDGQYNAFMKALSKIFKKLKIKLPTLLDYIVTIPPGGKTDALVETVITWRNSMEFKTRGLDSDQTAAAIKATVRMLNIIVK